MTRMHLPLRLFLTCTATTLLTASPWAAGAEWNRFRGPNGAGSVESAAPETFDKEAAAWRTELLPGYSSPVLTSDRVFLTGAEGTRLLTYCIDRESGEILWEREAPEALDGPHPGPNSPVSSTPTTDGENVYAFFENYGLVSYDGDGEERWKHELGPFRAPYGIGASPLVAGDQVIMLCDQDVGSFLVSLDAEKGTQRWKTERPGATHGFSTPILYTPDSGDPQVVVSGSYQVAGYSIATGEKLWWMSGMAWQAKSTPSLRGDTLYVHSWMASPSELGVGKISTPWEEALEAFDANTDGSLDKSECTELGLVGVWFLYDLDSNETLDESEWSFALSRARAQNGLFAIRLGARGDLTEAGPLWRHKRSLPNIPSPVVHEDVVYVLKEGGILSALDAESGEVLESGRIEGAEDTYYASPIAVGAHLITASNDGRVARLQPGADWTVLSVHELGEPIWATPAAGDGQVFIRTQAALYCFESAPEAG